MTENSYVIVFPTEFSKNKISQLIFNIKKILKLKNQEFRSVKRDNDVIIDMMTKINPEARFFTLDTGRLDQETYDVMDQLEKKYNIHFEVMFPDAQEVEEMVRAKGINLFYDSPENRRLCCGIRKVHPLKRMLSTLDGWITGIRKDRWQSTLKR